MNIDDISLGRSFDGASEATGGRRVGAVGPAKDRRDSSILFRNNVMNS